MTIRVAINGYGRIGRCVLRAIFESKRQNEFEVVAINDLSAIKSTAHLTRYDTTHGRFASDVNVEGNMLTSDLIVSNASCTTNCLAPVVKPLNDALGIEYGLLNTVHAYTNDQKLLDGSHEDLRRARAAAHSIIPTKTGAAAAVGLVLPDLAGKLDGFAMRVPVINVSVIDLTFTAKRETTVNEVNDLVRQAKSSILQINDDPLVSCDFNHNPASAIFDTTQTKVFGNLVKIVAWYDNEWGFSNRMLDTAQQMMSC
ncbi:MAG: aldehyde dehydrogenase [Legionella longbeachae]|nr:aldehyde dehydrogenase [Legionella longbeachae]